MGIHGTLNPKRVRAETAATSQRTPEAPHGTSHQGSNGDWHFEAGAGASKTVSIDRIVGESQVMRDLRTRVAKYAATEETVLISGETGTGKELIAGILHDLSPRQKSPFVTINCATIPKSLAESELFGCIKGAYTGAVQARNGLFARANGGTLFLDEFGELELEVQSKLLRALELGAYRPVGANREVCADVRVIAATNRDLETSVSQGNFRADLYYRVKVLEITAPPLRKHGGDIPQITGEILEELLPEGSKVRFAQAAMDQLLSAPWYGNVRELKNVIRRALIMSTEGVIELLESDHLTHRPNTHGISSNANSNDTLTDVLTRNQGRISAVAEELNVSVRTVQRRMKDNGLRLRDFRTL